MNPLLRALATNPALPPELIDRLTRTGCADVADALAARDDLGHAQAVALAAHADGTAAGLAHAGRLTAADIDPAARPHAALALLAGGTGRPGWARLFAGHPVVEHRERLAACPGLPPDVVETLAADPDVRVVTELALWATGDVAERLARHPHAEVRSAVAANDATPPHVLAALLTGEGLPPARRCAVCDQEATPFVHDPHCARPDCELRPGAACDGTHQSTVHETYVRALANPATPAEAVVRFTGHPSTLLRRQLAARSDLRRRVCGRLAGDPAPGVRAELAANPVIGEALTRVLAADRDPEVRRGLAFNPRVPLDVLMSLVGAVRTGTTLLPRIAAASPAEVETLAAAPDPAVRALLAQRRDLPDGIRDALAADTDAKVVKSVARHPGLSEATLRAMLDRYGDQVVAGVAGNPDAPPPLLEDLALRQPPVRRALQEVARHRNASPEALLACLADRRARRVAAAHPALPPHVLAALAADPDEEVAEAAAANPALPPAVMRELVRAAAGG